MTRSAAPYRVNPGHPTYVKWLPNLIDDQEPWAGGMPSAAASAFGSCQLGSGRSEGCQSIGDSRTSNDNCLIGTRHTYRIVQQK